jgi:hypothetical protein
MVFCLIETADHLRNPLNLISMILGTRLLNEIGGVALILADLFPFVAPLAVLVSFIGLLALLVPFIAPLAVLVPSVSLHLW